MRNTSHEPHVLLRLALFDSNTWSKLLNILDKKNEKVLLIRMANLTDPYPVRITQIPEPSYKINGPKYDRIEHENKSSILFRIRTTFCWVRAP